MSIDVRRLEGLSEQDAKTLFGWDEDIFEIAHLKLKCRREEYNFVIYEDGKAVSHAGLLKHIVNVDNQKVSVGGIGSVVTIPSVRGKGYATEVLKSAVNFMRDELKVEFGFLFCLKRNIPFYQKLGWQKVISPVIIEQPGGKISLPSELSAMVIPCQDKEWPSGNVELNSLMW